MQLAWSYTGRTAGGKVVRALVSAPNAALARYQLKRAGLTHPVLRLDLVESVRGLLGRGTDPRERARLYRTLGSALRNNTGFVEALEAATEYLSDARLKSQVAVLRAAIADGQKPADAMLAAGFPQRDAMVVAALAQGGEIGAAFVDLAADLEAAHRLDHGVRALLAYPRFMFGFLYAFLPVVVAFIAPNMQGFFRQVGEQHVQMPGFSRAFYALVDWCHAHAPLAIALYVAVPVALVLLARSRRCAEALDRVPAVRQLAEKREHALLWASYALLYRCAIAPREIADTLAPTVRRADTRRALLRFARRIRGGDDEATAVQAAGFPRFAVAGFRAAKRSSEFDESLTRFARMLDEDVLMATDRLKTLIERVSLLAGAALVLLMFLVVLYPVTATFLRNL